MGSVVSRTSVSKPHCCHLLLSSHTFLLMGFPFYIFQLFSSAFFPRRLLHPCSFVLVSSYFSVSLSVSLCLSFCLLLTVPTLNFSFSVFQTDGRSRGHGEGLGGVMAYRVEGYTVEDIQSERLPVYFASATSLCSPSLC